MNLTSFDKVTARKLQDEMEAALQGIAAKYNVGIHKGGGTIGSSECKLSFRVVINDAAAKESLAQNDFNKYCSLFGLRPEDFGSTFTSNGKTLRLAGLLPNRPKFPIKGQEVATGTEYIYTDKVVPRIRAATDARLAKATS